MCGERSTIDKPVDVDPALVAVLEQFRRPFAR
jgi:hypothetical protein